MKNNLIKSKIVNDFCITISTINGSGSATANNILLRALFKMGIPVSGKNIFPSNIQGQPTWFSIRLSRDGYLARLEKDDIVIAMNPETIAKEISYIVPNGVLFYADDIEVPAIREDITYYPMPVKKITKDAGTPSNLLAYVSNMVYVGILAATIGIDLNEIKSALEFHFHGKQKAIDSNYQIISTSAEWARSNLEKKDAFLVERMDSTKGFIMADGNTAGALGTLYGGMQFCAWYPITPASSLPEALIENAAHLRKDPETGKMTCAIVQAEDELAAIGMVVGAGWAGLRAMTATSGPGFSLMSEYLGLAYYAEVPLVVWNVQRVGPSTGLPTRTAQGDITSSYFVSHGDTQFIMLFPSSVNECFEFGWKAFDIAERLQTPVFVMIDLDLGMNQWMTKEFLYPDRPMDRGKILWEDELKEILDKRNGDWGRYLDIDGDGIAYRTLPGNKNPNAGYFARGTGHDPYARYNENPDVWEKLLERISRKFQTARSILPKPVISEDTHSKIGIIAFGSTEPAIIEARDILLDHGKATDFLRLRALPFTDEVRDFIDAHEHVYTVEMNRDGQLKQLLCMEFPKLAHKIIGVSHIDGLPLTAKWVVDAINEAAKENK